MATGGSSGSTAMVQQSTPPHVVWGELESSLTEGLSHSGHSTSTPSVSEEASSPARENDLKVLEKVRKARRRALPQDVLWLDVSNSEKNSNSSSPGGPDCGEEPDSESMHLREALVAMLPEEDFIDYQDTEGLVEEIPCDENGQLMSIGSIGHGNGTCKFPCAFVQREKGCVHGSSCDFCHFIHDQKSRSRPCKGQRIRYRRQLERLMGELEKSPEEFDANQLDLPPSIVGKEALKAKLFARLEARREQIKMLNTIEDWDHRDPLGAPGTWTESFVKLSL